MSSPAVATGAQGGPVWFAGRYEVVRRVGQGGFGSVFEARDTKLDRTVAVKVAKQRIDDTLDGEVVRELFRREAQAAASLRHPSITMVHDFDEDGEVRFANGATDQFPLIVMEFVAGPDLAEVAEAGALDPDRAVKMVVEVLGALEAAHQVGVLHRDVKPANIIVPPEGPVKLTDFGIARITGRTSVDVGGGVLASLVYASPEQLLGSAGLDGRADLYSAGSVLYELLTGRPPFVGDANQVLAGVLHQDPVPPVEVNPDLPEALSDEVVKALAKDPADRHQTAAEMTEALGRALLPDASRPAASATAPTRVASGRPVTTSPEATPAPDADTDAGPDTEETPAVQNQNGAEEHRRARQQREAERQRQAEEHRRAEKQRRALEQRRAEDQRRAQERRRARERQEAERHRLEQLRLAEERRRAQAQSRAGWAVALVLLAGALALGIIVGLPALRDWTQDAGTSKTDYDPEPRTVRETIAETEPSPQASRSPSPRPTPEVTASDQVRHMVEILETSAAARAQLGPAVTAVAACRGVSGQVVTLEGIAANRRELLAALATLPVDKVPDGAALVSLLRSALEASLGSDEAYLAWARAQESSGCASGAGSSYYQAAEPYDSAATERKKVFVSKWNSEIAPAYGVAALQESQI
jgi:serine/threonine protein kinase